MGHTVVVRRCALCGSPALRRQRLCYYHARPKPQPKPVVPNVADPNDRLAVIHWTMNAPMTGKIDHRVGGQLLYGVQLLEDK